MRSVFGFLLVLALARTALGQAGEAAGKQINAIRTQERINIDGELNEAAWKQGGPATGFIQGEPATEQTEVWVLYDDENLYVGAICHESDMSAIVVNDLRRDFSTTDTDVFEVALDTFDDDRNGYLFGTNPVGAKFDGQLGSNFNRDWDGIWYTSVKRGPRSWQLEMAIPFRTLRFKRGEAQVWGINFLRRIRRKSEDSFWSPIPRPFRVTKVAYAGVLHGVEGVRQSRNLKVKPYLVTPITRLEGDDVDVEPDAGFDVKMGVSSQLTLDMTVNTDFSQVEADEEQVNLTRFSLFFPEKREFFLENASIFQFGRSPGRGGRGGRGGGGGSRDLVPFFSRRIGISDGQIIPILAGARLTGRIGKYNLGLLSMQTDSAGEIASTNFSIVRVKRDVLRRSEVGGTFGFDGNFTFFEYLDISSSILKTESSELAGDDTAGQFEIDWDDNLWKMRGSFLSIDDNFNPEVGFVPRSGMRRWSGEFGYSPWPGERIPAIRAFQPSIQSNYITNQEGGLETRATRAQFRVQFQDGSNFTVAEEGKFERLIEPFEIREGQEIEVGDYAFNEFSISYSSDRSKAISGNARVSSGGFFDGDRDAYSLGVRLQPNYRLRMEGSWSHNDIMLPTGDFSTELLRSRVFYSFNTRMFLNTLIQYNSAVQEIVTNIRFNFIYKPLSDFFLVYNERRSSTGEVLDRALIAKITYLFDF